MIDGLVTLVGGLVQWLGPSAARGASRLYHQAEERWSLSESALMPPQTFAIPLPPAQVVSILQHADMAARLEQLRIGPTSRSFATRRGCSSAATGRPNPPTRLRATPPSNRSSSETSTRTAVSWLPSSAMWRRTSTAMSCSTFTLEIMRRTSTAAQRWNPIFERAALGVPTTLFVGWRVDPDPIDREACLLSFEGRVDATGWSLDGNVASSLPSTVSDLAGELLVEVVTRVAETLKWLARQLHEEAAASDRNASHHPGDDEYAQALSALGLTPEATSGDIRRARRKAARTHHPDLHTEATAEERAAHAHAMARANAAYDIIRRRMAA